MLTTAQALAKFRDELAVEGFDKDFVRDALMIALDRIAAGDDGLVVSE